MAGLAGVLISSVHQRSLGVVLWVVAFIILSALAGLFVVQQIKSDLQSELDRTMATYMDVRRAVLGTFDQMDAQLTAQPCSPAYVQQQRRIAFLPGGLNELFHARDGAIVCTMNRGMLSRPLVLGAPDLGSDNPFGIAFWFNRSLDFVGLEGLVGTFAIRGQNGMVVPLTPVPVTAPKWLAVEVVVRAPDGRWWHTNGEPGLFAEEAAAPAGPLGFRNQAIMMTICDPAGLHCLTGRASIGSLFSLGGSMVGLILLVCAVLAAWIAQLGHVALGRYWSLEQRFLRRFRADGVFCLYQPLLNLRTDLVTGCEVLARWRDVDGAVVPPNRFLPIIEKHGLTERFTALVVARAHADLVARLPQGVRLQVNFNIFPQDLDAARLITVFAPFLAPGSPFDVVVEIVETAEIHPETAQIEIERLRAAGIRIYIDDFGAGYSSMHNLAELSIDGVKLDRSFAMASDDSVMARMLDHAIELVRASGRSLVVEGVETAERLKALKACGGVDFAQGYCIARPLDIDPFIAFFRDRGPRPSSRPRLVA